MKRVISLLVGFGFGAVLIGSEAFHVSRISEMFHFQSFHMFGLLFSAVGTAALSLFLIKKFKVKSINGQAISPSSKPLTFISNLIGGLLFGTGWAITGACSAPLFLLVGFNWQIGLVGICGAVAGTLIFGLLKNKFTQL